MDTIISYQSIILALFAAAAMGLAGSFALMKRMTLAGDALSHVALPGIGIALLIGINPIIGAAAALILGALFVARLERHATLATETAVGVVFTAAVALGAILTTPEELIDTLFGGVGTVGTGIFWGGIALAFFVTISLFSMRSKLLLMVFSKDLALSSSVKVNSHERNYLLLFVLAILLGLKFLGVFLVGALLIIPAATARQLTHDLRSFLLLSMAAAVFAVAVGYILTVSFGIQFGPAIVLVSAFGFLVSLLKKKW